MPRAVEVDVSGSPDSAVLIMRDLDDDSRAVIHLIPRYELADVINEMRGPMDRDSCREGEVGISRTPMGVVLASGVAGPMFIPECEVEAVIEELQAAVI